MTIKGRRIVHAACLSALFFAAGCAFYRPGQLGSGKGLKAPLEPPSQEEVADNHWKVEDDISLYYFGHGKGTPVLVLHGGPGFPRSKPWKGLELIDDTHRFHYYHQRGCGESTRPADRFESGNYFRNLKELDGLLGMKAQLADIERIRKILGVEKLVLVGHSFGGFLATLYAVEFPGRVEKMVLVSPAGMLTMPPQGEGMDAVKAHLSPEKKREWEEFQKRYFDYGSIFEKDEKELADLSREYLHFPVAAMEAKGIEIPGGAAEDLEGQGGWMPHALYLSLGRRYDYRPLLRRVGAPVLVIHGEDDIFPSGVGEEYADLFPEGRFVVIPGASHFAFDEQPDKFGAVTGEFLK